MLNRKGRMLAAMPLLAGVLSACPSTIYAKPVARHAGRDALKAAFRDPPVEIRPRVWWHWLDGNISKDGIAKDLAWMKRIGLGGMQNFDGNFALPKVVDHRVVYMSPAWQDAFRYTAALADKLDLELGVAGAPGWSETGGPWVRPQDALKKFAWSETTIEGGRRFLGVLSAPAPRAGPFQDLVPPPEMSAVARPAIADYSGDTAVLAWRVPAQTVVPEPVVTLGDGKVLDAKPLLDGALTTGIDVPRGSAAAPTTITFDYGKAVNLSSMSMFIAGVADLYSAASIHPLLEMSEDRASWRKVAHARLSFVPTTISFAPATARYFRVTLAPSASLADPPTSAPGYAGYAGSGSPAKSMRLLDLRLSPESRVNQFELKAAFAVADTYANLDDEVGAETQGVAPDEVIDISDHMKTDGSLDWTPPPGVWRVARMGYSLTGAMNHPASAEATGLEVDKLDGAAVRDYLETYLGHFTQAVGPQLMGKHGLRALVNDSSEVGAFNWTPKFLEQFRRLRGYDAKPWLPTLTGAIVGTRAQSDGFLFDFRRTIAELHASQHYGTIAAVAHEHGLRWYSEALEGGRTSLGDNMDMRKYADVPMSALWSFKPGDGPKFPYVVDVRGAASVAHIFGQNVVAAESMTSTRFPWAHAPADLRPVIDAEFANGMNLPVVHTSVHQPTDQKPGLSMRHIGQFFTRNETWADMAGPWVDYMARTSLLLRQGRYVADVAYFYGEEEPTPDAKSKPYHDVPTRNGYDYVNASVVRDLMRVEKGALVVPAGARYRLLYLGGSSDRMTLPMLRRIAALVEAGADVAGPAPQGSPALGDDPAEYEALVHRLWSGQDVTLVGKGRVVASADVESALSRLGIEADLKTDLAAGDSSLRFVHRKLSDGEAYFIVNVDNTPKRFDARFRVSGKAPEVWRADTATSTVTSYRFDKGSTVVPITLRAQDSLFVMFRKPATVPSKAVTEPIAKPVALLNGAWTVTFEEGRGAPASTRLAQLTPLNEQPDPRIKYFSGIATYQKTFELPAGYKSRDSMLLDLGRVGDLAEVSVNGHLIGTVWHAPYRIDLGPVLRRGSNTLRVRVADLWVNRLIGDAQSGAVKITSTVMPTYRADAPLRPAGLIGPVTLLKVAHRIPFRR